MMTPKLVKATPRQLRYKGLFADARSPQSLLRQWQGAVDQT